MWLWSLWPKEKDLQFTSRIDYLFSMDAKSSIVQVSREFVKNRLKFNGKQYIIYKYLTLKIEKIWNNDTNT